MALEIIFDFIPQTKYGLDNLSFQHVAKASSHMLLSLWICCYDTRVEIKNVI